MMTEYHFAFILLTTAVLIAYANHRFIRMQTTIAIMTAALLVSLSLLALHTHINILPIQNMVRSLHFQDILLQGMLGFLLFAGALTIDYSSLKSQKWEIATLASVSTIASAGLIGTATYYILPLFGIHLPWIYALLFGALISPTDPIAVLATFKAIGAPPKLQTCIAGESLFNDGVGIVLFTAFAEMLTQNAPISISHVSFLLIQQTLGGLTFGFVLGLLTCQLIKPLQDAKMIILLTLSAVSGGYTLALWLGISGPLAMVILGIMTGRHLRAHPALFFTVETFWEVIDEILNAILFLLIGCEMIVLTVNTQELLAMLGVIVIVLLVRWITVAIPLRLLHSSHSIRVLTWGGLRGGLALALALSLPSQPSTATVIALTYAVVTFSVIVQGITIKRLL